MRHNYYINSGGKFSESTSSFVYELDMANQIQIDFGGFYTGQRISLNNYIRLKFRPWINLELRYIYNWVDLKVYGKEGIHLFAPRVEISFSNKLFWTTFFQYNTLAKNMNINSRLQWRYAPMSDLYLVLGNNFGIPEWNTKDLGLALKLTKWFQL